MSKVKACLALGARIVIAMVAAFLLLGVYLSVRNGTELLWTLRNVFVEISTMPWAFIMFCAAWLLLWGWWELERWRKRHGL